MSNNEETQWEQLHAVLNGTQNFCVIEETKAPVLYALLEDISWDTFGDNLRSTYRLNTDGGEEIVFGSAHWYNAYTDLLASRPEYARHHFQVAMGTLLGYGIDSCLSFARNPPDCDCEKCGGAQTDEDRAQLLSWTFDGCPSALKGDHEVTVEISPITRFDDDGFEYQDVERNGFPYGRLYAVNEKAVRNNPSLHPHSRGV